MLQPFLVGRTHGGAFICPEWELRITARCLRDDLGAEGDASFEAVEGHEIVKAFKSDRFERSTDTRQVSQIRTGVDVWVLSRGHDHRGATVHDAQEHVIWLVAYGRHRSGAPDDFFPYCRSLAAADELLPTDEDYERLMRERDRRFVETIAVEAAHVLDQARSTGEEQRATLGGRFGSEVAVEVDDELEAEAITVALRVERMIWDYVPTSSPRSSPPSIGRRSTAFRRERSARMRWPGPSRARSSDLVRWAIHFAPSMGRGRCDGRFRAKRKWRRSAASHESRSHWDRRPLAS